MALDLSNWKEYNANQNSIGREWSTTTRLPIGPKSEKKKQKVRIVTNIKTGDYDVFAIGKKQDVGDDDKDIKIYSYDADKNKVTINDTKKGSRYYDLMFEDKKGQKQFDKLNKETKLDTYNLAQENAESKNQIRNFEELGKKKGYKSAANQAKVPPQTITSPVVKKARPVRATRSAPQTRISVNTDMDGGDPMEDGTNVTVDIPPVTDRPPTTSPKGQTAAPGLKNAGAPGYLRYPYYKVPKLGYDYIQIQSYDYVPVGLPLGYKKDNVTFTAGATENDKRVRSTRKRNQSRLYKNPGDIIQLPMIGSISETNAVSWTDDRIDEIKNIAAGIAFNSIDTSGDPFSAVFKAASELINSGQQALMSEDVKRGIAAYFAGQAAGVPTVLQRATGQMINNNLELLFNGPNLRSFNFAFQFRPRSKEEAYMVRNIIRSFKAASAPKLSSDYMFLETPKIFEIKYIYNSKGNTDEPDDSPTEHPYMNKIKPCALTGLSVNYTPDGSYMTYEDGGSMTGYDLSLTFKEIEPVYQSDQLSTDDNMGY